MMRLAPSRLALALLCASAAPAGSAAAQSLAARVERAPEGSVRFHFAARSGVCGDGQGFLSVGGSVYMMNGGSLDDARERCRPGPVFVVLDRAGGAVIDVDTFVGGTPAERRTGADLGAVPAREAAEFLLGLAARLDGSPGRAAILPAVLADSAQPGERLLAIARDRERPRETRRAAVSWIARVAESPEAARRAADALAAAARDAEDQSAVRQAALASLGRLAHGAGVPVLVALTRTQDDAWLAREALDAVARSGDPRARELLRAMVARGDAPEPLLAVALRGLAREYATARDAALLREAYPRLQGERLRGAVLQSLAAFGGTENARWLLDVAQRADERPTLRRQALQGAARAGAPAAELVRLWDRADAPLKELLLAQYAESGDRAATERLMSVAKGSDDPRLRRRAVQYLSRSDDPRARALLQELVVER